MEQIHDRCIDQRHIIQFRYEPVEYPAHDWLTIHQWMSAEPDESPRVTSELRCRNCGEVRNVEREWKPENCA